MRCCAKSRVSDRYCPEKDARAKSRAIHIPSGKIMKKIVRTIQITDIPAMKI